MVLGNGTVMRGILFLRPFAPAGGQSANAVESLGRSAFFSYQQDAGEHQRGSG